MTAPGEPADAGPAPGEPADTGRPAPGWLAAAVIARRELGGFYRAPIAYVVGVSFLVLQGLSFSAVVSVLSDPERPAPYGAVLREHFGGTFWYWAVLLFVVSAIAMRAVAEERRQGTWEVLLTAPVSDAAVIVGKWLGALGFYALLWTPTAAYLAVLLAYAPDGAHFDLGPVAAAYLGVIAGGAAFLAVGIAASAATANQIIAAVAAFAALMLVFALGQVADVAPGAVDGAPSVAAALAHVDVRGHMRALAGGEIALAALAFYAGLTAVALAAAQTLAAVGRRRRGQIAARAVATALIAVIAIAANILAARHPARWDVTRAQVHTLDPDTRRVLAAIDDPVEVLVVRAGLDIFADLQAEVDRLLARMVAAQPRLRVRALDPALDPDRISALAREFAVSIDNLADGGAVVFQRGERRRVVDLLDMAGFDRDDLGAGRLARFRAEAAFASALAELSDPARPTICTTGGHGELTLDAASPGPGWAGVAARARRDGADVERVGAVTGGVPARCRALVIAGPARPLTADEAIAVADYLARGGRVLVALRELLDPEAPRELGLELVLAAYGLWTPPAVVLDPSGAIEQPEFWLTISGYADHPVTDGFRGRRVTAWAAPRPVAYRPPRPGDAAADDLRGGPLVSSSPLGWGEADVGGLRAGRASAGEGDVFGPVAIAAWAEAPGTGARIVVFGGAGSLADPERAEGEQALGGGALLAAQALAWLTGRVAQIAVSDKTPEQLRLVMTDGQRALVFAVCVGAIPLGFLTVGAAIWWRRREQ